MWAVVAPLLPEELPKPKGGRPRVSDRDALRGIVFVLRTGMPWEMLPREVFGCSGMTCWRRLRDWQQAGVWDRLHRALLERLDRAGELDWSRASLDAASIGAKRMARPGCKRRLGDGVISLHKRIRHVGSLAAAKMEIRASRSS
jgi:transposase